MISNLPRPHEAAGHDTGRNIKAEHAGPLKDETRYRQVRRFFRRVMLHVIWWDIILNLPLLRRFRKPLATRWQQLARSYRIMAIDMGGVLIKLGQFLSTRVDLLPVEVTDELAKLQDQVPPVPFDDIVWQMESDFGRPVSEIFAWCAPHPIGAASLAQVHRAQLCNGENVVVKVLRPGIDRLVEADLAVLGQVIRRMKRYKPIRLRVDLDALIDEFTTRTRHELNLQTEAHNAERFAQHYQNDPQVHVLKIFWEATTPHTLTMEDVSYFRLDDVEAIQAAGIDLKAVAQKVFGLYLEQFFVHHFVHADPHAGNVFIKPLPHPLENGITAFGPGDDVPFCPDRPFQVAFVDFGMVADIPERLQGSFREYIIGIGTRDARRIVQSYVLGGSLRPGADLARIEALTQDTLDHFWGTLLGQFNGISLESYNRVMGQYFDVFQSAPFQFQAELLYVFRAMGILSGIIAHLDSQFDPWPQVVPLTQRLMQHNGTTSWQGWLQEGGGTVQLLSRLPTRLDEVLTLALRGKLTVQNTLAPDTQQTVQRLRQSVNRQTWITVAVGLFVSGMMWHVGHLIVATIAPPALPGPDASRIDLWLMGLAGVSFLWGMLRKV